MSKRNLELDLARRVNLVWNTDREKLHDIPGFATIVTLARRILVEAEAEKQQCCEKCGKNKSKDCPYCGQKTCGNCSHNNCLAVWGRRGWRRLGDYDG